MAQEHWQTDQFEQNRPHLKQVAHRMLGSDAEAEDAVQETWMRFSRSETAAVENMRGWLTTVLSRICLDMLRARQARREEELVDEGWSGTTVDIAGWNDPEQEALMADSVGVAMLVVLETLTPAERLAFVLHDLFAVPFDEIAPIVGRTPTAARQLASRARRRVQGSAAARDADQSRQREIVEAFMAAARGGDFEGLLALLDPDVTLRADTGVLTPAFARGASVNRFVTGAREVADQAYTFHRLARFARLVLVNGLPGIATVVDGAPVAVMSFAVRDGKIVEIDVLADSDRLSRLDLAFLNDD
jgi:RNA polymerase sigma factor (sigma-70 family)